LHDDPFITVVMPVRNEERFIRTVLEELLSQDYPPDRFEVLVADGLSTDRTRDLVAGMASRHPQIRLYENRGRLPSSGRNVGFRNGRGEIFLVVDGHCRLQHDRVLRGVVDCFRTSRAQCLCRPQPFIIPAEPTIQRAIALARSSKVGHSSKSFIHAHEEGFVSPQSAGCAYLREVIDRVGLVDESFDACEDVEFNYRVEKAGFKSFFSPLLAVHYVPREDLTGLWRQLLRYGKGRCQLIKKHPEIVNFDMLLLPGFVLGIFLGPVISHFVKGMGPLYALALCVYLVIIGIESFRLNNREINIFFIKLLVVFFTIHMSLGVGMLVECVRSWVGGLHRKLISRGSIKACGKLDGPL
jgi:glycosyltransferase involved in cell wall biosynthesis